MARVMTAVRQEIRAPAKAAVVITAPVIEPFRQSAVRLAQICGIQQTGDIADSNPNLMSLASSAFI
jgi:hypothetical protein